MNNDPKDKVFGTAMIEWIARAPNELPRDAVGLWQIVSAGVVNFDLSGSNLVEFVGRSIMALLDAGALPVRGGNGTSHFWIYQPQFGATKDAVRRGVIAEWQRIGNDVDDLMDSIWFALPRPGENYVKMS